MRITRELLDLCIDYDRQAKDFKQNCLEGFDRFLALNVERMEILDKELAKYEENSKDSCTKMVSKTVP